MAMADVLVTRVLPAGSVDRLRSHTMIGPNPDDRPLSQEELVERAAEVDAIVCLLTDRIDRAVRRPFGRRFHLRGRERATAELRGPQSMRGHAAEIIAERLAPAEPRNDGRQTPYRNHPVFVAQHATATCCRSCLETWHGIAKGRRLDRGERAYVVEVIGRWIDRELATSIEGRDPESSTSRRS